MPRPPEEIRTERLWLHKHRPEEADAQYRVVELERARLAPWIPWMSRVNDEAGHRAHIETMLKAWEGGEYYDYTLKDLEGRLLGGVGAYRVEKSVPRTEFGYWLRAKAEGRGYISEAVRALEGEFFRIGFERLEIRCDPRNARSFNVPQQLGYTLEGVLRRNARVGGELQDTMVWAKIRADRKNP